MRVDPFTVILPKRRRAIFDAIVNAGEEGISEEALDKKLFSGKGKSTVRSAIHYINKSIAPLKIDGRNGYRVIRM
jgi:hypothetical protein